MGLAKTRVGNPTSSKLKNRHYSNHHHQSKSNEEKSHILLARGLTARYCGANTPLTNLTVEEMERDLRHMEAYNSACTAYAQQYYIYQNSASLSTAQSIGSGGDDTHNHNGAISSVPSNSAAAAASADGPPLIAMPVRIDPEEEKRLATLRLKIQHCEAQREVLESEYLSLRAHYVDLSQTLKQYRSTVTGRVQMFQDLVQKRGALLALQRTRLQVAREALACLQYRQSGGKVQDEEDTADLNSDLVAVWNTIDEEFKKAAESCFEGGGIDPWEASKVPKIPFDIPLFLSPIAEPGGFAAGWLTSGMFGSHPESLCWLNTKFPEPTHRLKELPALREEAQLLENELNKERRISQEFHIQNVARRKKNDELVAMMALLRTETEAVVARHNILLESDIAKDAAQVLQEQEESTNPASAADMVPEAPVAEESSPTTVSDVGQTAEVVNTATTNTAKDAAEPAHAGGAPEDLDNDGDDEGGTEEEDDGEIVGENGGDSKRSLDESGAGGAPRLKRRKL